MRRVVISILAVVAFLATITLFFLWSLFLRENSVASDTPIYINQNCSTNDLIEILKEQNLLKKYNSFRMAAKMMKLEGRIKPGRYIIKEGMSAKEMVTLFLYGLQEPHNLILAGNIRSYEKLASLLSQKISSDSTEIYKNLTDSTLIDSLGFTKENFLGLFLLNSYQIYWTTSPKNLILRLHKEYQKFWNDERVQKANFISLTPNQVITLASIVAEETNIKSEYKKIAGLYLNRLKIGMPLQADPTIKFALNDPSIKRILYSHLTVDSPYNTYKIRGLPPGPIVIPSPEVIDAVLNYSSHNYLYFCADSSLNGSHRFATTLAEHNRNARAYHRAISKLR